MKGRLENGTDLLKIAYGVIVLSSILALFACGELMSADIKDFIDDGFNATLSYAASGNTSGTVPASAGYCPGDTVTVSANTGSLSISADYVFSGWNTAVDGTETSYSAGDTFTIGGLDLTLYAVWEAIGGIVGVVEPTVPPGVATGTDQHGNANERYWVFDDSSVVTYATDELRFACTDSFSVSVWFNAASLPTSGYPKIFTQSGGGGRFEYFLMLNGESQLLEASVGQCGTGDDSVACAVTVNEWHHAVITYNGSILELFVDGLSRGTVAYTYGPIADPTMDLTLGGGKDVMFNGTIGDFRAYDRVISADEIVALYNN